MKNKEVTLFGLGYIGLPTAAMLAVNGVKVTGVDLKQSLVNDINKGLIRINEPGLDALIQNAIESKLLVASTEAKKADVYIIAVPTPLIDDNDSCKPDLTYIKQVCLTIAPLLDNGNLIILESTSPVGTTEMIMSFLSEERPDLRWSQEINYPEPVQVAYCPERVIPGKIIEELIENDRIIGGTSKAASLAARDLYSTFVKGDFHITDSRTAEMAKLAENSFRDVQIAFANELSIICDELDIDVRELISLTNKHPRVNVLRPGPGVGGHCIAVDPWFIVDSAPDTANLIKMARFVNERKTQFVVKQILETIKHNENISIILFGASYKENIDDLRESPTLKIGRILEEKCKNPVKIIEPNTQETILGGFPVIDVSNVNYGQDLCVFLVRHDEFMKIKKPEELLLDVVGLFNRD